MDDKRHIAVLMGGPSHEHEISLLSGKAVVENLDRDRYKVTPVIITHANKWIFYTDKITDGSIQFDRSTCPIYGEFSLVGALQQFASLNVECIFNAMHGPYGEDGIVQGMFEAVGISYTGSPVLASSVAMDKIAYKHLITGAGIPTAQWSTIQIRSEAEIDTGIETILNTTGLPCVLKTPSSGSSIGVELCETRESLSRSLRALRKLDTRFLVEKFLEGREFTCAILGNAYEPRQIALPPTEIISKNTFFDYEAKYSPEKAEELTPAPIDESLTAYIQQTALAVHNILGCKGVSRTDFIWHNEELYVLETNTLPGLTVHSLLPKAACAAGITMPELLDKIIRFALLAPSHRLEPSL